MKLKDISPIRDQIILTAKKYGKLAVQANGLIAPEKGENDYMEVQVIEQMGKDAKERYPELKVGMQVMIDRSIYTEWYDEHNNRVSMSAPTPAKIKRIIHWPIIEFGDKEHMLVRAADIMFIVNQIEM